jgi:hypothetical protein
MSKLLTALIAVTWLVAGGLAVRGLAAPLPRQSVSLAPYVATPEDV